MAVDLMLAAVALVANFIDIVWTRKLCRAVTIPRTSRPTREGTPNRTA
jgi:hypothetical protein